MTLLFVMGALAAGEAEFQAGNEALAAGRLPDAERGYREALAAGAVDADVYYNLGNVLFREDRPALAILAWRRALALAPRDPDSAANLDFARRGVRDDVVTPDPAPAWAPWQAAVTADEGMWIGGAMVGAGLLLVAARRRATALPLAAAGSGAVVVGTLLAAGGLHESVLPPAAVVLVDEVVAQSDLGGGVALFTLHAGAEVQQVEVAAGQVLVALGDGRKGWVAEAAVGTVDPFAAMP